MAVKKREIYAVRFNKLKTATDMFFTEYTVGAMFFGRSTMEPKLPLKIELIKDDTRVLITFDGGTYHEIGYSDEVELFWRDVETKVTKKATKEVTK